MTDRCQPLLVLVHIPKTAGSALRRLLAAQVEGRFGKAPNTFTHAEEAEERLRRLVAEQPPPLAIGGHIVFGLRDVLPADARYLTVLREPVARTLSHYGYLVAPRDPQVRPHGLLARATPYRADLTLEEALADPRYLPDNLQTRMLTCRRSPFEPLRPDALEQAKSHLRARFAYVGVTERFEEFAALLTVAHGWQPRLPRRRRVGETRLEPSRLDPALRRALEAHNALDLELYALASELQSAAVAPLADRVRLEQEAIARARSLRGGGPPTGEHPVEEAAAVEARARLLLAVERADRVRRRLARERG